MTHPDDREKAALFKNAAITGVDEVERATGFAIAGVAPPPVILSDPVFAPVTPGVSERSLS